MRLRIRLDLDAQIVDLDAIVGHRGSAESGKQSYAWSLLLPRQLSWHMALCRKLKLKVI
jgi:hypothetical protein